MDSQRYLVLTAVGPDRPGLVNELSALIHDSGANLEDSRMAVLGGEFAVIMLVGGVSSAVERVKEKAPALEQKLGLSISVRETERTRAPKSYVPYRIRVTGVDRPGIVHSISEILARRAVNVASLESRLAYAPLSGTPMFVLDADLEVPSETALAALRRDIAAACEEDNLDFLLEPLS